MLFSRVKIREIENKIKELYVMDDDGFIRSILENLGEWKRLSHALEILNSDKNNDRPILLLDGLDEINQENQRILLDRLNRLTKSTSLFGHEPPDPTNLS